MYSCIYYARRRFINEWQQQLITYRFNSHLVAVQIYDLGMLEVINKVFYWNIYILYSWFHSLSLKYAVVYSLVDTKHS